MQKKISSKIGTLYLVASNKGLQGIFWNKQPAPMLDSKILLQCEQQLTEYLDGKKKNFNIPLDIIGTEFQKLVWQELAKIPYGVTKSYKDIAIAINNKNACRAVGNANGKNPIAIIIPCHRVIAANGTIGGYAGGLAIKRKLLKCENINIK